MKLLLFCLFSLPFLSFAQCDTANVISFPEVSASFPGGPAAMKKFIVDNAEHFPLSRYECFTFYGPFYIKFIVCDDGTISNVELMRPSDSKYAQLAIELVEKMPKWIPGEQDGVKVSSFVRLPIRFTPQ